MAQAIRQKKEKLQNYGKYVKEMYWPKISTEKQSEMSKLRERALKENTAIKQVPS